MNPEDRPRLVGFAPSRIRRCLLQGGLALLAAALPAAASDLFATRLTAENLQRHRVGGPDAIAGIGDWALGNGVVCAAITDLGHESMLTDQGGLLVDLGHCGRNDDQWGVLQPMLNLSREETVRV